MKTIRTVLIAFFFCTMLFSVQQISFGQSVPLPTDRGRLKIVSIPDVKGGANLKVIHTDANTPLRGAAPWIENKFVQQSAIRENFIKDQADAGMNSIRLIWFEAWQKAYGYESYTDFNNPTEVAHTIAMMETYVNLASKYGMYCIINFHNAFQRPYDEAYATQFWTVAAAHFKNRTHVAFETANEPSEDFSLWMQNAEMQKHANIYNLVKNLAPNTMQIVLTPNRLPEPEWSNNAVDLANKLSSLTTIDWTNTAVGYHLYAGSLNAVRHLHKAYPALATENNFPTGSGASNDGWASVSMDGDWYTSQTCEKLGIGWLMWAMSMDCNCYEGWYSNWPLMLSDAQSKGWYWAKDVIPNTQSVFSEAETSYTVVSDQGSNGSITPESSIVCSNNEYLALPDIGDEVSIAITIAFAGDYDVLIRVRSGWDGNPTYHIDGNAYEIRINDELKSTALVEGSVSTTTNVDSYYGTLISTPITLNAGVNYIRVKALVDWLKVDYVQAMLVPDTQAPTVPTDLTASEIITTKFNLSWTASMDNVGVTSYEVFQGTDFIGTSATNSMIVTGLTPNTTSFFTVVAKDAAGNTSAASTALSVTTMDVDITIRNTSTPPVIDGAKEATWNGLFSEIGNSTVGSISSETDLSATWTVLWDNTNLYIFASVTDDGIMIDSGTAWYDDDRVEVFIDAGFTRTNSYGPKQYQYYVRPTETTLKEVKLGAVANTQVAYKAVTGGYNFEIKIPFATLGVTPSLDMKFGIDVQVGDDDDGGGIDGKLSWFAINDNTWQNPSLMGIAKLGADVSSGMHDNLANPLISIFPNPANEKLTISNFSTGSVISVISLDGRVMSTQKITGWTVDYDVSSWNKGIYLFKIQENNNLTIKRAIIY